MGGIFIVDLGLLGMFLGALSLIRPLAFLGLSDRRLAAFALTASAGVVVLGASLPAREVRISSPQCELDRFFPAYQFHEFHSIRIPAPPERVYRAVKQVSADEIFLFRSLVWIRRLSRPGPENILNPPPGMPLLEVASKTSFLPLAEEPNREIVLGTLIAAPQGWRPSAKPTAEGYQNLFNSSPAGFVFAGINFRLQDCGTNCTLLTTETRVFASSAAARRRFARYWRVIYPGSAFIRRMWLRAIANRAKSSL
jgi:hypothetical protein